MRDDAEYWQALSARIVSRIRDERGTRIGWQVWAAPLAVAAVLMLLIAQGSRPSVVERPPSIAALLAPDVQRAPNIAQLLGGPR